jgi:hypothetical protein
MTPRHPSLSTSLHHHLPNRTLHKTNAALQNYATSLAKDHLANSSRPTSRTTSRRWRRKYWNGRGDKARYALTLLQQGPGSATVSSHGTHLLLRVSASAHFDPIGLPRLCPPEHPFHHTEHHWHRTRQGTNLPEEKLYQECLYLRIAEAKPLLSTRVLSTRLRAAVTRNARRRALLSVCCLRSSSQLNRYRTRSRI